MAEWEERTGVSFPKSSEYVVPDTLQPVIIDWEQNVGPYEDPTSGYHTG